MTAHASGIATRLIVIALGGLAEPATPATSPEGLSRFEFTETHMGSPFRIVLYSADAVTARSASRSAFDRIAALDAALSDYDPESELMRLCDRAGGAPVPVSEDLFDILQRSQTIFERSDGAFDPTVGPVVRLWRRARRDHKMPAADRLEHARSLVGAEKMVLDRKARTVQLLKAGMKLDLGGIAKGYASDEAIKVLKRLGHPQSLVAGAGDVVVGSAPPGRQGWTIGIAPVEAPDAPPRKSLLLHDVAISTSGDAERFVEIDGRRYSHIVDPHTGLGVIDRCSVTVIAPDGATADGLDTAAYVLGPDRGLALIEATPGAAASIARVTSSGTRTYESQRFPALPSVPAAEPLSREARP